VIGTYGVPATRTCIDVLGSAGGVTKYNIPPVLNLLRAGSIFWPRTWMPNPDCCAEVSPNLILAAPAPRHLKPQSPNCVTAWKIGVWPPMPNWSVAREHSHPLTIKQQFGHRHPVLRSHGGAGRPRI